MTRRAALPVAVALALATGTALAGDRAAGDPAAGNTGAEPASAGCGAPPALMVIGPAQARVAARIGRGEALTIVAVGSSSTQGSGASAPGLSYPSRLEAELKNRFPAIGIRVINRGKGGEDVTEELARLDREVIAERPDLVIWQVGTNAVLRRDDLAADRELIERGVAQLKQSGSDVVLMDLQYAPRVIARPAYAEMEQLIANAAKRGRVGLFRRFEMMQKWQAAQPADAPRTAEAMIGPDGLHMTDRGYFCLAANLADALAGNWWSQGRAAQRAAQHPPAARVAGLAGSGAVAAVPFGAAP
ncbi:MAG TPA: SGNH/GDSL hydrolase family protein [Stellaceae bacterium]